MPCMCNVQLEDFVATIEARMEEMQMAFPGGFPELPALPQPAVPELPGLAMGLPALASPELTLPTLPEISAAMELAAGLPLPAPPEMAALEAMAAIEMGLGMNGLEPGAGLQLPALAETINFNTPALGELAAALPAFMAPMLPIAGLAGAGDISAALGVDLTLPGAIPQLEMALATPELPALPSADFALAIPEMDMSLDWGMLMRLINAAGALGIDLTAPGGTAELALALESAAGMAPPALDLTIPEWANLIALMGQFAQIDAALSFDLAAPGAGAAMAAELPAIEASLAGLSANLGVPFEIPAPTMAAGELGLALNAGLPGMAELGEIPAAGIPEVPPLPDLSALSMASMFCMAFEGSTGVNLMPPVSCPVPFCFGAG